jgi:hypothetical protein
VLVVPAIARCRTGKRTLAVVRRRSASPYAAWLGGVRAVLAPRERVLFAAALATVASCAMIVATDGPAHNALLAQSAKLMLATSALYAIGVAWGAR